MLVSSVEPPTSLQRGGADTVGTQALVALMTEPTSLNGGKGLPGKRVCLEASWGGEDEGGGLQRKGLGGHRKTRSIRKLKDKDEKFTSIQILRTPG